MRYSEIYFFKRVDPSNYSRIQISKRNCHAHRQFTRKSPLFKKMFQR